MSYSKTLARMIKESGLTLKEIAQQVNIDPSYLSKLQSGKQSPASDDVNITIAKVCKADPDLLLFEGYIEKAPEVVKRFISKITDSIKEIILTALSGLKGPDRIDELRKDLDNMSPVDFLNSIYGNTSLILQSDKNLNLILEENDLRFTNNPFFGISIKDESMEPLIKKNSLANIDHIYTEVEDGDYAIVNTPKRTNLIRRVFFMDDKVILIPENNEYPKEIFDRSEINFVGKVNSIVTYL